MPEAGPYGITQFDAPGIIGAYQNAQQNRIRMMAEQKQLEREDAEAQRTSHIATAWSKVVGPSSGSKAVDAYGSAPAASTPSPAPTATPAAPVDPLAVLPDKQAAPAPAAAPAAAPSGPTDQINQAAVPELLSALGPEAGTQFLEHWQTLQKNQQEVVASHMKDIGQAMAWADTPEKWNQAIDVLSKQSPQLAQYRDHFDQRGQAALQVGAISSFVEASKPDMMTVGAGQSVIDKAHPEQGPLYTAPEDYEHFTVTNADGTTTPYGFDKKTGKTFQLQDAGAPGTAGAQPGGFDHAVAHVLSNEGGYNQSDMNGAPVNFGINQKANPGVDVKNMTVDQAKQIYHDKYWVPSGAESLPANMQAPYFDVYIRNPAFAKKALAESGGDPAKFMAESSNYFQTLAQKPSGQRYAQAWAARDAKNTAMATGGGAGTPISGKPMTNDPDTTDTAKFIGGQVALGQPMPPLGMGKQAAAMRQAILAEATKQWKAMGISPGEANVIAAQNKSGLVELSKISQMKAQVQTAENTASSNATQVLSLLGSAGSTGSPIFNAWQQAGRRATGDSKVSAFDVAVKTLSTEYARVMSGGNSQQLSDTARHEADALIHTSMTPDQFRSTIKQMKIDMANRTAGIEAERQATLTQIRSGGRAKPAEEGWKTLPSGLKIRKVQ